MRVSQALPSSFFCVHVPWLSGAGHYLVRTRIQTINALWYASVGSMADTPLEQTFDLLARVIGKHQTLDETVIRTTIPLAVAAIAGENGWCNFSTRANEPSEASFLELVTKALRRPIARWSYVTAQTNRDNNSPSARVFSELCSLPSKSNKEPEDVQQRRSLRKIAVQEFQAKWSTTERKIRDIDIAYLCGWRNRSLVVRFKSGDPRNSYGTNQKIWNCLLAERGDPQAFLKDLRDLTRPTKNKSAFRK